MHWKFPREMTLGQGLINRFRRIDTDRFLFGAGEQKFPDNHRRRGEAAAA